MRYGYSNPKFYIYDSTGVTLQKTISLSPNILSDKPIVDEIKLRNTSPYTRTKLQEALGYYYRQTLTAGIGDYNGTLQEYQADQADGNKRNDVFKLQQVLTYCNAGYVVKFTPHADLEDLWGFSPFQVFVTLDDIGYTGTNKTDMISVTVEATALTASAFLWYEFSFTELNGVTNANQCLSLDGTTQYATCTLFNISTTHSIEFWIDTDDTSGTVLGKSDSTSSVLLTSATNLRYTAGSQQANFTISAFSYGTKNHCIITRSGTSVSLYINNVLISTQTLGASSNFEINQVGLVGSIYLSRKLGLLRAYPTVLTQDQRRIQYNSGNGNWPLDISPLFVWEFNGTGGTGTSTETDQSGNSRTLTLVNTPTRTTW